MKQLIRKILKSAGVVAVGTTGLLFGSAASAQDANLTVGVDETYASGTHNGFYYSVWKDSYDLTVELLEYGRYTARWNNFANNNNWVGGKGWNPGGPRRVKYTGNYSPNGNSYLALYGWADSPTQGQLIEYYIVEAHHSSYSPKNCGQVAGHSDFSYTVDGVSYSFGVCERIGQPSIRDSADNFLQFFAVRQGASGRSGDVDGFIDTGKHFAEWTQRGYDLTNYNYMVLASEGYGSSGSSDITMGETDCGTSSNNMPICCSIDADPDNNGTGEQFAGEVCEVTEETVGWHPPNPESIIAAINAGGSIDPVEKDGIWYRGNFRAEGATANPTSEGTLNPVYQSEFWGENMILDIPIPEGTENVKVTLGFVEIYHEEAGARVFDVSVEGESVITGLDLFAEAGGKNQLLEQVLETTDTDGSMTIELTGTTDNATISAILVEAAEAPAVSSSSESSSSVSSEPASSSSASVSSAESSSSEAASSSAAASSEGSEDSSGGSLSAWMLLMLGSLMVLGRRRSLQG